MDEGVKTLHRILTQVDISRHSYSSQIFLIVLKKEGGHEKH